MAAKGVKDDNAGSSKTVNVPSSRIIIVKISEHSLTDNNTSLVINNVEK